MYRLVIEVAEYSEAEQVSSGLLELEENGYLDFPFSVRILEELKEEVEL